MTKANLCLHSGASTATREQVDLVLTPERTETWVPIPHSTFLNGVQYSLAQAGLNVVTESHGLTREGLRYFGLLQVAPQIDGPNGGDFGLVVGVRNSHDRSFPAALALGATVFVCDNLSFSGEVKLARKHTAKIERDLPQLITRAVGMLGDLRKTQATRFLTYKQTELSDRDAHDLVVRAIDAQVVPVTAVPDLLKEWRNPRHPEFCEGKTSWRLFNAVTEVLKGNLQMLPRRTQALHGLMDSYCGILAPTSLKTDDAEIQVAAAV